MPKTKKMKRIFLFPLFCILAQILFTGCKKIEAITTTTTTAPDPNGNWLVTVVSPAHCSSPLVSKLITVSGGNFNAVLQTYTNNGCTETMSIYGTLTMGNINFVVSGNETLAGTCCNGTNGFFSYIDPTKTPISGNVQSNWGSLKFTKQ